MSNFYEEINNLSIDIKESVPMSRYTTFKIGGAVKYMVTPKNPQEVSQIVKTAYKYNEKLYVVGNGSNMLICDEGIDGVFMHIGEAMSEIQLISENTIKCSAGALLVKVCNFALEHSLEGMETAYGIPGSVGGGLYMNAGAYGGEMKDYVVKAEFVDREGNFGECDLSDMKLSYRHSAFADDGRIITAVYITLKKGSYDEIKERMKDYMFRRKSKQPLEFPSAGSVFKRPEGYFAGALIEECGLKGKNIGGAFVSEKHAGFIVNKGGATAKDVLDLIELCKKTVKSEKGVELEPEIRCLS